MLVCRPDPRRLPTVKISVIFTTYNSPQWLENVLWGFHAQDCAELELVIADDGSGPETRERIDALREQIRHPIRHVWHEDDGFRKCRILNRAILASQGDYLIFTDGDCIPRADFVSTHQRLAAPGQFLSGGYFKLPLSISEAVTVDDILKQRVFDLTWLRQQGLPRSRRDLKLSASGWRQRALNALTPARASWNGHNASTWRELVLAANGFDERLHYGGEDREFGERLINAGVRSRQIRYSAVCVHLEHARGYVDPARVAQNRAIRKETRRSGATRAQLGLDQLDADSAT